MSDFEGYKVLNEDTVITGDIKSEPTDIKLVKMTMKKNQSKWTVKNTETNKRYFIKIDEYYPESNMYAFLTSIGALGEGTEDKSANEYGKTEPINIRKMIDTLVEKGEVNFLVPEEKIGEIENTWFYKEEVEPESEIVPTTKTT
jgi:hypothetical protein